MATRTKRTAAKTSKKRSSAANPSKTNSPAASEIAEYTRTPAELDLVEQQRQRRERQSPAPKMKVRHAPPEPVYIEADHPDEPLWLAKLNASMGTTEWPFAKKVLSNLLETACAGSPSKTVPQEDLNAALAAMHGIGPRDEAEAMLAAQMVATHTAAMVALRKLKGAVNIPQQDSNGNLAVKLLRTYALQLEALARYRGKGQQKVIVEHVHVHPGGQAIVGAVNSHTPPGGGGSTKTEHQPHAIAYSPGEALPGAIEAHRETVPVASG